MLVLTVSQPPYTAVCGGITTCGRTADELVEALAVVGEQKFDHTGMVIGT